MRRIARGALHTITNKLYYGEMRKRGELYQMSLNPYAMRLKYYLENLWTE